jgi:peptide/nickel transport system permease protein
LLSLFIFSISHMLPGDPIDAMVPPDEAADPEIREILIKELGLDRPLMVQYFDWLWSLLHGDFGQSIFTRQPVKKLVFQAIPATLYLAVAAFLIAVLVAIPLGTIAAVKKNTRVDYMAMVAALLGVSIPGFWMALMFILFFSLKLGWLPSMGHVGLTVNAAASLKHLLLPALVMAALPCAIVTRMIRSSMLDELKKEYVNTPRSQGLPQRMVIYKYTLKNALIPTITMVGLWFARLLAGTIIIETIFGWPGIGSLVFDSINARDYPVLQAAVLMLATAFVTINLIVDLLYKLVDPKVQLS